jgi:hypothetical protein
MFNLKTEATDSGKIVVAGIGVGIASSQLLISADKFSIKGGERVVNADKTGPFERRLCRIESFLGLNPTCAD